MANIQRDCLYEVGMVVKPFELRELLTLVELCRKSLPANNSVIPSCSSLCVAFGLRSAELRDDVSAWSTISAPRSASPRPCRAKPCLEGASGRVGNGKDGRAEISGSVVCFVASSATGSTFSAWIGSSSEVMCASGSSSGSTDILRRFLGRCNFSNESSIFSGAT
jgi:hypothetical protein